MAIEKLKKFLKHHFHEIVKIKKSPQEIALGFAIGSFIVLLPTPGFSILIGLLIMLLFTRINKFSLFAAMAVWNPLTLVPIYWLSYRIGDILFGALPVIKYDVVILD